MHRHNWDYRAVFLALVLLCGPAFAQGTPSAVIGGPVLSAAPSGAAGGDLGGSFPAPTVINGSHITNSSIPNTGLANPSVGIGASTIALGSFGGTSGVPLSNVYISGLNGGFVSNVLFKTALPFIVLPTGTMANNGAFTLGTALPTTYASAYCWFPAGAIAASGTGSAAGWYYCTFSSSTAGIAFNNTYASGQPTIPGSPTAFATTAGTLTGATATQSGPTFSVPGGTMGIRDTLRGTMVLSVPANTNSKNAFINIGGTVFSSTTDITSTSVSFWMQGFMANRESISSQVGSGNGLSATSSVAIQYATINTANAMNAVGQLNHTGAATDFIVIEQFTLELIVGS